MKLGADQLPLRGNSMAGIFKSKEEGHCEQIMDPHA